MLVSHGTQLIYVHYRFPDCRFELDFLSRSCGGSLWLMPLNPTGLGSGMNKDRPESPTAREFCKRCDGQPALTRRSAGFFSVPGHE
jgi:hypothetical protein